MSKNTATALVPPQRAQYRDLTCLTWVDQLIVVDSSAPTRPSRSRAVHRSGRPTYGSATQKDGRCPSSDRGWTLIVDAVSDAPVGAVLGGEDPPYSGYFVNRRNLFFGHWIKHAGMYPSWNLRLFRTGQGVYETKEVDADVYLRDGGKVGYLRHDMLHYSFPTIESCINRINRYSGWDARERRKPREIVDDKAVVAGATGHARTLARRVYEKLPAKPLVLFLYMYLLKGGFLDGRAGYYTCGLWAFREFVTEAKYWELGEKAAREQEQRK